MSHTKNPNHYKERFELSIPEGSFLDVLEYKHWRHRIELTKDLVSPGYISEFSWLASGFPNDLKGKSVLDIGANDGLNSFLAESRGASFVTATDIYFEGPSRSNHQEGWSKHAILLAKKYKDSRIDIQDYGVYDLEKLGRKYDYAIISDVVTWLPDIPKALETISRVCNECIVIREGVMKEDASQPLLRYDHAKTGSHWFTPNIQFFKEILPELGFKHVKVKSLSNTVTFDHWIRSFPIIHSDKKAKVYSNPWTQEAFAEFPSLRHQGLMKVGNRIFLTGEGWVDAKDVRVEWIKPGIAAKVVRTIIGDENFLKMKDRLSDVPSKGVTVIGRR